MCTWTIVGIQMPRCGTALTPLRVLASGARGISMSESLDGEFERVAQMSVGDIKAELELRGVNFAGCFEKGDLVRRLVLARKQGEADPSIVDRFNADNLERSFRKGEGGASEDAIDPFASAQAEGISVLPGGMSPETVKKLAGNVELMAVLQNPKMQAVLKDVMESGPIAFQKHAGDSEVVAMIEIFQKAMAS